MKLILSQILAAITIVEGTLESNDTAEDETNEYSDFADLNFIGIANACGKEAIAYDVITEDGYNLTLFNVPGNRSRPVLLVHGFIDSADAYILRGNTSLVLVLSNEGYDVWVANFRGNKYSRRHTTLNPDGDKKFWDFSFHEIGYYDMAANIDFILETCGVSQLQVIGYSEGTTVFYVLGTTRPEYNNVIKILISMAPICHLDHVKPPALGIVLAHDLINNILIDLNAEELLGNNSLIKSVYNDLCNNKLVGYPICGIGLLENAFGFNIEELEPEFYQVLIRHFPTGTSRKNGIHLAQLYKSVFRQYDYGYLKNLKMYGSVSPPAYKLSTFKMKNALLVANNDKLSTKEDVETLKSQLPNGTVVEYRIIERKKMNHYDFIGGKHMYIYLFPHILEILEKYK